MTMGKVSDLAPIRVCSNKPGIQQPPIKYMIKRMNQLRNARASDNKNKDDQNTDIQRRMNQPWQW